MRVCLSSLVPGTRYSLLTWALPGMPGTIRYLSRSNHQNVQHIITYTDKPRQRHFLITTKAIFVPVVKVQRSSLNPNHCISLNH